MLSAIETAPRIVKAINHQLLGQFNVSPAAARSAYSAPDVIVSLGRGSPATPTYNSAGLLGASLQQTLSPALTALPAGNNSAQASAVNGEESAPPLASIPPSLTGVATTADPIAAAVVTIGTATIASAVDAVIPSEASLIAAPAPPRPTPEAAPSPANTSPATAATAVTTAMPTPTPATAAGAVQSATATTAADFSAASVSQTMANVIVNPAYAAIASSHYLSVAAYRTPQTAVQTLLDRTDTPRAVNGLRAAKEIGAEGDRGEAGNAQTKGGSRARG